MLSGGCLCGRVRYEVHGAISEPTSCHCSLCRRASGAPFVAWFTVPAAHFRLRSGELSHYRSSASAVRGFCAHCGSALTFQLDAEPGLLDVTIATLDDPNAVVPADHIFTSSRLTWLKFADDLPEYANDRPK